MDTFWSRDVDEPRKTRVGMRRTTNHKGINKYKKLKSQTIRKESKSNDLLASSTRSPTAFKKIEVLSETYDPSTSKIFEHEFDDDYFADSSEDMEEVSEKSPKSPKKTKEGKKSKKKKVKVEEPTEEDSTVSGQLFSNIESLPTTTDASEATKSRNDFSGNVRDDFKDVFQGTGSRKVSSVDFSGDATVDFYESIMKNLNDFSGSVVDDFVDQIKQDDASGLNRADFNGDVAVDFGRLAVYSFSRKVDAPMVDFSGNVVEDFREQIQQGPWSEDDIEHALADGSLSARGLVKFNALVERDFKDLLRLYNNFRAIKMPGKDSQGSGTCNRKDGKPFDSRLDKDVLIGAGEFSGSQRSPLNETYDSGMGRDLRVSFGGSGKLNSSHLYTVFSAAKFASEAGLTVPGLDNKGFVDNKFIDFIQDENQHTDVRHVIHECAMNRPEFKDTESFHSYLDLYRNYYQSQFLCDIEFDDKTVNAFALVEQQFKQYLRLVNMFTVAKMYNESGRIVPGIDSNGFVDERFVDYLNKIFNVNVRKVINDSALLTPGPEIKGEEANYIKEYLYFYSKAFPDPDIGLTFQDYGTPSHLVSTPSCTGGCPEKGGCCRENEALNKVKSCDVATCKSAISYPATRDRSTSVMESGSERKNESCCHAKKPSCEVFNQSVQTNQKFYFRDEEEKQSSEDSENECDCIHIAKRKTTERGIAANIDNSRVSRTEVGAAVERSRSRHSVEDTVVNAKEPRLTQRSSQNRVNSKDSSRSRRNRKLSFTDQEFPNVSSENFPEKTDDEDDFRIVKEPVMHCVIKNRVTKSGRRDSDLSGKHRKLRFECRDHAANKREDDGEVCYCNRGSHSAGMYLLFCVLTWVSEIND